MPRAIETPYRAPARALPGLASQRGRPDPGRGVHVYIVLGVLYESWIQPVTILSTALRGSGAEPDSPDRPMRLDLSVIRG